MLILYDVVRRTSTSLTDNGYLPKFLQKEWEGGIEGGGRYLLKCRIMYLLFFGSLLLRESKDGRGVLRILSFNLNRISFPYKF